MREVLKGKKGYRSATQLLHSAARICVAATSTNGWLIGGTQINTLRHCRESQPPPGTRSMRIYCLWTCIATSMAWWLRPIVQIPSRDG